MMRESELTYTQYVNLCIRSQFEEYDKSVIYGQNIVAGSRISGLGAGLEKIDGTLAVNTTNSENSLMGMGFGLSLSGIPSLFLMKQHDFALLGLDQLVNTNNVLRQGRLKSPFLVLMVIVDSGFEGPQATLSSLDEFASLSKAPVHFLSTKESIDEGFKQSQEPGLHFLALGQANMKKKVKESGNSVMSFPGVILYPNTNAKDSIFAVALVFYGVDIEIGLQAQNSLLSQGVCADLFVICQLSRSIIGHAFESKLATYSKVVVIDTGKSEIHYSTELALSLSQSRRGVKVFSRIPTPVWSEVSEDSPEFDVAEIVRYAMAGEN
jgi:hypothetical protein